MSVIGNSPGVASQRVVSPFTATAGQTTFTPISGYTIGYCDVFLNGIKLANGDDYTAADGTTVVLAVGAAVGDFVEVVAYFPRGLSDGYLKAEADARFPRVDVNTQGLTTTQKSNARTNIGAQADLGYTPLNKAGDSITGTLQLSGDYTAIGFPSAPSGDCYLDVAPGTRTVRVRNWNGSSPNMTVTAIQAGTFIPVNGIDFSANSNASGMTSELFDDYEVGTWTPSLTFLGASVGMSQTSVGTYVKVGKLVWLNCRITVTNKGTSTGSTRVTGLPFTAQGGYGGSEIVVGNLWSYLLTNTNNRMVNVRQDATNTGYIELRAYDTGNEINVDNTWFNNGTQIAFTIMHYTA